MDESANYVHNKKAFLEAVGYLRPLFKSKVSQSIKVFERVVFDQGMMSSFDGQVMITVPSPWGEQAAGSCRGVVLYDMLSSIQSEEVQSRFEGDNVIFEGGTSKLETSWMSPSDEDKKTRQFMLGWTPGEKDLLASMSKTPELELALRAALLSSQNLTYRETSGIWLVYDKDRKVLEIWASDSQTLFRAEFDYTEDLFTYEDQQSFRIALSPSTVQLIVKTFEDAENTLLNIYEGGIEVTADNGVSLVSPISDVDDSFLEMAWNFSGEIDNSDKSNAGSIILDKEIVQSIKQSKEAENLDFNSTTRVVFDDGKLSIETSGSTITMSNKMDENKESQKSFRREYLINNISTLIKAFNYFNKIEFLEDMLVLDNTEIEGICRRYVRVPK